LPNTDNSGRITGNPEVINPSFLFADNSRRNRSLATEERASHKEGKSTLQGPLLSQAPPLPDNAFEISFGFY